MSEERAALKRAQPQQGVFGRGPMAGFGMPVQKARDFKGTLRRLTGYLPPHRPALVVILAAGVVGTLFGVLGPKILAWRRRRSSRDTRACRRGVHGHRLRATWAGCSRDCSCST
ncbi:MAG: hypothetical protein R2712_30065 [Vicinamibacterales bacterium]